MGEWGMQKCVRRYMHIKAYAKARETSSIFSITTHLIF